MNRIALRFNFLVILLSGFFLNPRPLQAFRSTEDTLPSFADFSRSVENNETNVLRGVYVPHVLALPIVQQPADQPYYVSSHEGEATQFSMASQYGNTGLLAHNSLSGKLFSALAVGQEVRLVYGDGRVEYFVIAEILRFQALQPESVNSSFKELEGNKTLSAGEVFNRAYVGERRVVFQTCIAANGNASWGRLFIVARPKK